MKITEFLTNTIPADASCRTVGTWEPVGTDTFCLNVSFEADDASFSPTNAVEIVLDPESVPTACQASVLSSPYWCRPAFFAAFSDIPENTQALLWKDGDENYGYLLPLPSYDPSAAFVATVAASKAGKEGTLSVKLGSFAPGSRTLSGTAAVFGTGKDPYRLMENCAKVAADKLGIPTRRGRYFPEVLEYLGWCSWDAMQIGVSEAGLTEKCHEFAEKHVPVRWVLIDDMWANIDWASPLSPFAPHKELFPMMHASTMQDYEADPVRFPKGLMHTVTELKKYGMKVGIWHPTTGYWAGLTKGGAAAEKLAPYTMTTDDGLILPDLRDGEKAFGFYDTLHTFLSDCGADFVKVDNQSALRSRYHDTIPVPTLAKNQRSAIERSVDKHFDGQLINCMGMSSEVMFSRPHSAVSRCSDDFQPENAAWFAKHATACAYNGLVQGQFYVNDFDMFWTDDSQALRNSVLRAVSGGPIYISDKQGRTHTNVLAPLTLPDGRILRCDGSAVPGKDHLCEDPTTSGRGFSVINRKGEALYLAGFNLDRENRPVKLFFRASDYGFTGRVILYEHFSGITITVAADSLRNISLPDNNAVCLYTILPWHPGKINLIGIVEKYIGLAAVEQLGERRVRVLCDGTLYYVDDKSLLDLDVKAGIVDL